MCPNRAFFATWWMIVSLFVLFSSGRIAQSQISRQDPLFQIIEGAKKEGTADITLLSTYNPLPIVKRLEKGIKDRYGVDLSIHVASTTGMAKMIADGIMETRAGTPPSHDLMTFSLIYIVEGMRAGIFERMDWKPLLGKDTPPEVAIEHPAAHGSIAYATATRGLMYNPKKVSPDEVPKTLADLGNPRWKGKLGLMNYPSHFAEWAFAIGKDKTLADLRGVMKNQPVLGRDPDLNNSYLLGEFQLALLPSTFVGLNRAKGTPTEWQSLGYFNLEEFTLVVRKGARHPNAAKLIAIYLASPEGVKNITVDLVKYGSRYYPGNVQYDIYMQAKKQGIPIRSILFSPGQMDFVLSKEYMQWQSEIKLILEGGT